MDLKTHMYQTILNYFEPTNVIICRFSTDLFNKIGRDIDHAMPYFSMKIINESRHSEQSRNQTDDQCHIFKVSHNSIKDFQDQVFLTDNMVHFVLYDLQLPDITSTISMYHNRQNQTLLLTNHGWTPKYYLPFVLDYLKDMIYLSMSINDVKIYQSNHTDNHTDNYANNQSLSLPSFPSTVLNKDISSLFYQTCSNGRYHICITDSSYFENHKMRLEKMNKIMDFSGTRFCRNFQRLSHNGAFEGGYELYHTPFIGSYKHDFLDLFDLHEDERTDTRGVNFFSQRPNVPSWMFMSFVLCLKHFGVQFEYEKYF